VKKLLNDPRHLVRESLEGFALAHPDLVRVSTQPALVVRADAPVRGKVGIVSGGGSGHEPLHIGFVGPGMLDAAVPGAVFTSPTPEPILLADRAVDGGAGVLHIVKNYTGDVLNFELAAELAQDAGIVVRTVVVEDDVAVPESSFSAGRRGVAGTLLVEKLAGAAAERGDDLDAVAAVARRAVAGVRTMGVALHAGTAPHSGRPSFDLGEDEIELGVGIHGEPGRRRMPYGRADNLTDLLVDAVLDDLEVVEGEEVLLLVNGLGATALAELYVVYRRARRRVEERGAVVARSLVGEFVTSLDMAGASVTVLRLDDELKDLYDAPVHTAGLRWGA
jgi:dihydroxyacetone kinase-like protein